MNHFSEGFEYPVTVTNNGIFLTHKPHQKKSEPSSEYLAGCLGLLGLDTKSKTHYSIFRMYISYNI